jgi:tetratricopeptide (TPR) repeat protein
MSYAKRIMSVGVVMSVLLTGSALFGGAAGWPSQQASIAAPAPEAPITENELINLVKHNKKHLETLMPTVQSRGLGFELTPDIEQSLRKAGADDAFITGLKDYTPSARAAQARRPQVSPAEKQAYKEIRGEKDPDKLIQEANEFAQNYPKSAALTYVYALEAGAYQQKNDEANAVTYGEKSLQLNPNDLYSLLLVSSDLAQPQMLNVPYAEKEKRLDMAESCANKVLQEINQFPKQANETDETYQQRKDQIASGVYASLGMVHLERSEMAIRPPDLAELGKAEQSYKMAVEKSKNPVSYYRLGEIYAEEGKVDEAISAYSSAGKLAPGTQLEQMANQKAKVLKQEKAQAQSPAQP